MKINVFVDGVQVGTREGCDVLCGDEPCKKPAVGGNFFHEGLPRNICLECMQSAGRTLLKFKTSKYDTIEDRYSVAPAEPAKEPEPEPAAETEEAQSEAPVGFPACPSCNERSFSVQQSVSETKDYDWDKDAFKFVKVGDPHEEQTALVKCRACGADVPSKILSGWI